MRLDGAQEGRQHDERTSMNARWTIDQAADGVTEVAVSGDVDMAVEHDLHAAVRKCAEEALRAGRRVRIDLGGVEFMDSAGLRSLMRLHMEHGDVVSIGSVSGQVARLFEIAGVSEWLMATGSSGGHVSAEPQNGDGAGSV
jgi:anti-sigma B factor antagonist